MNKQGKIKGYIFFYLNNGKISTKKRNLKSYENKYIELGKVVTGESFISKLEQEDIKDTENLIIEIYVDGCKSNLGICIKDFCQGLFCVGIEDFKNICNDYIIEVNLIKG